MKEHGNFQIKVVGNVIHTFASDGFNEYGIARYRQQVLALTKCLTTWQLYEHIGDSSGLTPEAVSELTKTYQSFASNGCMAIAVEINSTLAYLIEKRLFPHLVIAKLASNDPDELELFLQSLT